MVYKLDTAGQETVLHSFTGGPDGNFPAAGLLRDSTGNLYGTTEMDGTFNTVWYSRWIRRARRLCCTVSKAAPMVQTPAGK